ncbi:DUF2975 domain-containing protein [Chitinophaga varians]|uniref:DUF2975 domain-containing protein n=1 Tax=Chitinophaga varians TaxID=2202339 RepID=UPI00165FBBDD|nr:DUF2975 domain-containing protein [Chitinophaga varians]MBC9912916.1 DUF2975 domain-containing protein [Chitinophaga varians]
MKVNTNQVLKVLYILSWIIFVGICVEAGGYLTNAVFAIVNPTIVKYLWHEVDLSALLKHSPEHFFTLVLTMSIVAILKAYLFYLIIAILSTKKLNLSQPFSKEVGRFIARLSYVPFMIGLFSWCGAKFTAWLVQQGVPMPDVQYLRLGGADVWLFMSVTLFVIAQIFRRGIELQTEHELTV